MFQTQSYSRHKQEVWLTTQYDRLHATNIVQPLFQYFFLRSQPIVKRFIYISINMILGFFFELPCSFFSFSTILLHISGQVLYHLAELQQHKTILTIQIIPSKKNISLFFR